MVLRACRHYGHTREYWWSTLTWPLYGEIERELAEHPPAEQLLAWYFQAEKWWSPPDFGRTAFAGAGADDAEGVWECPFPDVTD